MFKVGDFISCESYGTDIGYIYESHISNGTQIVNVFEFKDIVEDDIYSCYICPVLPDFILLNKTTNEEINKYLQVIKVFEKFRCDKKTLDGFGYNKKIYDVILEIFSQDVLEFLIGENFSSLLKIESTILRFKHKDIKIYLCENV